MKASIITVGNQDAALRQLGKLVQKGQINPYVRATALKIRSECQSRNELCELDAIFRAVKEGHPAIKGLERGLPYVSDPKALDWFSSADRLLKMCKAGACGADCDEHAVLNASLAGALGFTTGLRAYGQKDEKGFSHVYAVAIIPKKADVQHLGLVNKFGEPAVETYGMDSTVPSSYLGWQPPNGHYRTVWVSGEE